MLTVAPLSSSPAIVSTSPLGSVVLVGYHRPWAMGGPASHEAVRKSKMLVLGRPRLGLICPPATSSRPSGRKSCPPQNTSEGLGTAVKLPVAGSHTWGAPLRPKISTLPSGSRWRCASTVGAGSTDDHTPTSADCPPAV